MVRRRSRDRTVVGQVSRRRRTDSAHDGQRTAMTTKSVRARTSRYRSPGQALEWPDVCSSAGRVVAGAGAGAGEAIFLLASWKSDPGRKTETLKTKSKGMVEWEWYRSRPRL